MTRTPYSVSGGSMAHADATIDGRQIPMTPAVLIDTNEEAAAATGLLPCPFCTGTTTMTDNRDHIGWQVFCLLCHARGAVADTSEEAAERWNARAAAAADDSYVSVPLVPVRTVRVRYVDGGRRKPLPYPLDEEEAAAATRDAALRELFEQLLMYVAHICPDSPYIEAEQVLVQEEIAGYRARFEAWLDPSKSKKV